VDTVSAGGPAAAAGLRGERARSIPGPDCHGRRRRDRVGEWASRRGRRGSRADRYDASPGPNRGLLRPARVRAPHDRGHPRGSLPALASVPRRVSTERPATCAGTTDEKSQVKLLESAEMGHCERNGRFATSEWTGSDGARAITLRIPAKPEYIALCPPRPHGPLAVTRDSATTRWPT